MISPLTPAPSPLRGEGEWQATPPAEGSLKECGASRARGPPMKTNVNKPPRSAAAGAINRGRRKRLARARHSPAGGTMSRSLRGRLGRIKIFLCDVDGVLTDATVFLGDGKEYKAFNILDGLGLVLLRRNGIKVGWVSNRPSQVTAQRAQELKIDFLHQHDGRKVTAVETILAEAGYKWEEACYVGDDIVDLGVLKRAGLAVAVANAIPEAKALAHYVTEAQGGHGAVREVVRLILEGQGKWAGVIEEQSA
jgi:3-deoxy-D-manno-octulosonate 8-phosphate phosphatase (KDO 8-P phosphatase)